MVDGPDRCAPPGDVCFAMRLNLMMESQPNGKAHLDLLQTPCRDEELGDDVPSRLRFVHKMCDVVLACPVFAHRKDKVRRALKVTT